MIFAVKVVCGRLV
ncbi:hypothetical protein MO988_23785 [Vibrio vulnificus]|nr:hypothetical protein [Vibrio vulnificus]